MLLELILTHSIRPVPTALEVSDDLTPDTAEDRYTRIQNSKEFIELRAKHRGFVFPVAIMFFLCYMGYVVLSAYAPDFMSEPVFGSVNVALLLGVLEFVITAAVTTWYVTFARRELDTRVDAIRAQNGETTE
jgi:uncharacterized membrane protein (DUF485 family)